MAETRTEADAIAELAGHEPQYVPYDEAKAVADILLPPEWTRETVDLERYLDTPRRTLGTVTVHTADGFAQAFANLAFTDGEGGVNIYADEEKMSLVAVLNDDVPGTAGWRDHRISLQLRPTEEWAAWKAIDRQLVEQARFAEHVEDRLGDITAPDSATVLEMAQTFEATASAQFRGGARLKSGARSLTYTEEVDAAAGQGGSIEVPDRLELAIAPFLGAPRYAVTARFRFKVEREGLKLGVVLDRPAEVERQAFRAFRDEVVARVDLAPIAGVAPATRAALG